MINCTCGGTPHIKDKYKVECQDCLIQTAVWPSEVTAVAMWEILIRNAIILRLSGIAKTWCNESGDIQLIDNLTNLI